MTNPFIKRNSTFRMPSNLKNFIEKRKAMVNAPTKTTEAIKVNYDENEYLEFKKELEKILIERETKEKLAKEKLNSEIINTEVKQEESNISNEKIEIELEVKEPISIRGNNETTVIYDDASFIKPEEPISESTKTKKVKKSKKTEIESNTEELIEETPIKETNIEESLI